MSLPTKISVETLDYSYMGSPWCLVAAKPGIDLDILDTSYMGEPFWGLEDGETSISVSESIQVTDTPTVQVEGGTTDLFINICPENNWVPGVRIYTP